MEFSSRGRRNVVIFAVLALLMSGFTLAASTWQVLRQQEAISLQHMGISARSIAKAVENSYKRGLLAGLDRAEFWERLRELFMDVETGGDIRFIEIFDDQGLRLVVSPEGTGNVFFTPDVEQAREMEEKGEWRGLIQAGGEPAFVLALRSRPWERRHMGGRHRLVDRRSVFVAVGMSLDMHDSMYRSFRNNALLQGLYILAAAVFLLFMSLALLSRRSLAGKALFLERFQARLLDSLPDGILTVGRDQYIQAANPAAHELLALAEGELVGRSAEDLPEPLRRCLNEAPLGSLSPLDWRRAEVLGRQLEMLAVAFKGEHGEPVTLMLLHNRTPLRDLERSLAEAEKMAAIGALAAGVAHEIRNPLAALRGFAQYFAKRFKACLPEEEYAGTMVREADRLNRVVTDLLYLARAKEPALTLVDLPLLAAEVESLLRFDLERRQTVLECDFSLARLQADADALKQTLLNLVLNSLDALEEYAVQAEEQGWGRREARIVLRSRIQERWAVLEVEDNGAGMTPEQEKRVFEPFFTSKAKGTGLGLALAHKTMYEHGGQIRIRSAPLRGCAVSLFFPRQAEGNSMEDSAAKDAGQEKGK